jgi:hypothetical protein
LKKNKTFPELSAESFKTIGQQIQPIKSLYDKGDLSAAELVSAYILMAISVMFDPTHNPIVGKNLNAETWLNHKPDLEFSVEKIPFLHRGFQENITSEKAPRGVISLLVHYRLKYLSTRIQRALAFWFCGKYQLQLIDYLPSSEELLKRQASGTRFVSLFLDPKLFPNHTGHRDPFDFLLHDLFHADHFFENPIFFQGQKKFYAVLAQSIRHPILQNAMSNDETFRTSFEYLCSDMNSHPLHLVKTLKAILLRYFQNQNANGAWEKTSWLMNELFPEIQEGTEVGRAFYLINDKLFDLAKDGLTLERFFADQ